MLDSKDDKAAAIACREILDRAFGKPISPTELTGKDGAPLVPAPEMSDQDLATMTLHLLIRGGLVENEPLIQARKPTVIEQTPDPFARQRAEQAAEIAAAEEPTTGPDDTATRWSEMKAAEEERHAAPWRCDDHTPGFTKVVRLRPR